jgi:glucan phosphoethanolaminetransferase (alkaline phosphatase superfamily)
VELDSVKTTMSGGIPIEAVPVSVVVLLYSIICFTLSFLLVLLLISFGERWTCKYITNLWKAISDISADVTILSTFTALSYAISWKTIKEAQFDKAVQSLEHPGLAIGGAAQPLDVVLFFIRKFT